MNEPRKTNPNDEAFAAQSKHWKPQSGLTKREYFAAMALAGCVGRLNTQGFKPSWLAGLAVKQADALIEALNAPTDDQ